MVLDRSIHTLNVEMTLVVAMKQGSTAEAAISGGNKMIDSMVHYNFLLKFKWLS